MPAEQINIARGSSRTAGSLSRLLRTDLAASLVRVLTSASFLALCDQAVVSLGNFASGLVLGRLSGRSELGLYALCWTIVSLTVDLSGAMTTTPYTVFGPRMSDLERRRYVGHMFILHGALTLVVSLLIGLAVLVLPSQFLPYGLGSALIATATVLVLLNLREFARRICFAILDVSLALTLDVIFTAFYFAGLSVLWINSRLSASTVFLMLGLTATGHTAAWFLCSKSTFQLSRGWWTAAVRNWQFSKWILGSGLVWALSTYLYPWFLTTFHGTATAGLWASCSAIVAVGNPVLGGLMNYIGPRLSNVYAREGLSAMRQTVYKSAFRLILLLSPFALILMFMGGRLTAAIYGEAFNGTHAVMILLALNLLALSFSQPFSRGLFTMGHAKADMLVNILALALLLSLGLVTVRLWSLVGAAAALLISTGVTGLLRVVYFNRLCLRASHRSAESSSADMCPSTVTV